ncbi:hypothetical protein BDY19DRAFT_211734 [Irpex rosettiformis]|uniref:Uncharacterized protein n=1 Tax=Irpex rosettiformis TaxID=378272 RepID=A0ACB8U1K8_9APHY|nr:hypothetical protein BDY19DRAFT_211734 [Irpex rosettiformis]
MVASSSKQGNKANGGPVHIKRDRQPQAQQVHPVRRQASSMTISRQVSVAQAGARPANSRQDQYHPQSQPRRNNAGPTGTQDQSATRKRLAPEPSAPTLLSRLALSDTTKLELPTTRTIPAKRSAESEGQSQRRPNYPNVKSVSAPVAPLGGFSIKGAAIREQSEGPGSLLNRLVSSSEVDGGRNRRKRPKI